MLHMYYRLKLKTEERELVVTPYRLLNSWELTIKRLMKRFSRDNIKHVVLYCTSFTEAAKRIYQLLYNYFRLHVHTTTTLTEEERYWAEQINDGTGGAEEDAFLNGFKIFLSGLYPTYMAYDGMKHIYVNESFVHDMVNWNINSSVITVKNRYSQPVLPYHLEHITLKYSAGNVWFIHTSLSKYVLNIYNFSVAESISDAIDDITCVIIETEEDIAHFNRFMSAVTAKGQMPLYYCKFIIMDECTLYHNFYNPDENRLMEGFLNDIGRSSSAGEAEKVDSYIIQIRNAIKPFFRQYHQDKHVMVTFPTKKKQQWFQPGKDVDTNKFTQKEYVVFNLKDKYFIFSEYTNSYFEINHVIAKALEIFLYCRDYIDFQHALLRHGFNRPSINKINTLMKEKFKIRLE